MNKGLESERPLPREERVRQILETTGAILEGHFLLTSGLHGDRYINKDAIYPHTREVRELGQMWAEDFRISGVDTVAGPAMGGVSLSLVTASALTDITGRDVPGVYAEKTEDGRFEFKRGMDEFIKGKRVLVVEDVLTTGLSAKKVVEAARELGAQVIGVGVIVNRGQIKPEDIGVEKVDALIDIDLKAVDQKNCVQCASGEPINTKVGAGKNLAK